MHLILFDIDGTLVMTGGAGQRAFDATFAELFGVAQISGNVQFAGRSDRAIASDLFTLHGVDVNEENWQRFSTRYVECLADSLPAVEGCVLPGVVELVEQLAQRADVQIGLLTGNIRAGAARKLSHYGLWHYFPFGGFGDDHLDRDDIAHAALAEAREFARRQNGWAGSPDDTVHDLVIVIGDTPHDISCARAIGAHAVAVPTGSTPASTLQDAGPDMLLDSLADSAPLIQLLDAAL